jgi:hypothetical protein
MTSLVTVPFMWFAKLHFFIQCAMGSEHSCNTLHMTNSMTGADYAVVGMALSAAVVPVICLLFVSRR